MICPYCPVTDPAQRVIFQDDLVLFIQDERYQGSLKHSGIIIPRAHKESVFDLAETEMVATFQLLIKVKDWMDDKF